MEGERVRGSGHGASQTGPMGRPGGEWAVGRYDEAEAARLLRLGLDQRQPDTNKTEKQDFNGVKVTLVSAEGSLKAAPMAGIPEEIADAALLGAILEHAEGAVFVKMTGPAPLVKASREQFIGLVKSATEKK